MQEYEIVVEETYMFVDEFSYENRLQIGEEVYLRGKNYLILRIIHFPGQYKIRVYVEEKNI
jgi:hypothetical protein